MFLFCFQSPGLSVLTSTELPNWGYHTVNDGFSSQGLKTKSIQQLTGKMLGGSSGINFMFYLRGNKADYDTWVQKGNPGWHWDNVTSYFKKSEGLHDKIIIKSDSADLHNTDGNLIITQPNWENKVDHYLKAFEESGHDILIENNGYRQLGYAPSSFTIGKNLRQNTANAFLKPVRDRENLHVIKNTKARKILFDATKRAVGVEVTLPAGNNIKVHTKREIILSAGAINSPQLLMLSGIGPQDHLEEMDINVVVDSPNVGSNLQDHPLIPVAITIDKRFSTIVENLEPLKYLDRFPIPSIIGFAALNQSQTYPDYQASVFPVPTAALLPTLLCSTAFTLNDQSCTELARQIMFRGSLIGLVAHLQPKSRGKIMLKTSNPEDKPLIYSGYFSNYEDLDDFAKYIEDYVSVVNTTILKKLKPEVVHLKVPECSRFASGSHDYWMCYALHFSSSHYHPVGTCAMGEEGTGVLDERLRVRGVKGLRVVDASIMPTITRGNTNAPTIMIAEKAADMIKHDHRIQI